MRVILRGTFLTESQMSIGIVVVGPGLIGKTHISLVGSHESTHLLAIVAPDHEENRRTAREVGAPLFHSLDACCKMVSPRAVIISSPNIFHHEQARWCIERHIPVLIEKPIAASVAEALDLIELVGRHQGKALVGHHRAYSPLLAVAKDIISSGRLGRLVSFMGSAQFYKPAQYFRDGVWRTQLGGGPILINLIHEIGNMRTLVGEITEVQALSSSAIRGFAVEDSVVMNFRFASGALGTFVLSDVAATPMSWEQTSQENSMFPTYADVDCYTLIGTKGCLGFPTMLLRYVAEGVEASWLETMTKKHYDIERRDPLRCQLDHFVDLINGIAEARVSVVDGYRNLCVVEAVRNAIRSGRSEKVGF